MSALFTKKLADAEILIAFMGSSRLALPQNEDMTVLRTISIESFPK